MMRGRRLLALAALLGLGRLGHAQDAPRLLPAPRELVRVEPARPFDATITFPNLRTEADRVAAREFVDAMRERGLRAELGGTRGWPVALHREGSAEARDVLRRLGVPFDSAMRGEGYVLAVGADGAVVVAASDAGAFYALQTLKQLFTGTGPRARVTPALIRDWPAFRWRGTQDDLSRGPVPTLAYQKAQVRRMAQFKLNVLMLYFEHTLALAAYPTIAPPGGAMSREDVRELVEYAARFHVTVIPHQQTFGHLHHVLKQELFAPLAETAHGHVLAPAQPGSLDFARTAFAEIDSLFPTPFRHLGADETFDLGKGQTRAAVDSAGLGAVYVDYLTRITDAVRQPGRRYLFWGDIAMNSAALVPTLPKDLIAVAWEYSARRGFDRFLKPYRDAGMETWVAPGVSSWNRVWPNYAVALPNIQGFAREGQAGGATGFLNTTWDDNGDAIFEQTWYGVLFGAAAAWQPGEASIERFEQTFGLLFHGDTTGLIDAAQRHLSAAHTALQATRAGDASSYLFFVDPFSPEGVVDLPRLRPQLSTVRIQAESALVKLAQARTQRHLREPAALEALELGARRIDWLAAKFQIADEIVAAYVKATDPAKTTVSWVDLAELSGINGRLQDMRDGYVLTRELFERSWQAESRPYWLQNDLARYDAEILTWTRRIMAMDQARRRFTRDRVLPTPEELEIPRALLPQLPPAPAAPAAGVPPTSARRVP